MTTADCYHGCDYTEAALLAPVDHSWLDAGLQPEALRDVINHLAQDTRTIHPNPENVLRALSMPVAEVRVLILGQDPYPTPGHAVGLSFASDAPRLPRSLANIYKELHDDTATTRTTGNLDDWVDQGVLLLNTTLTVASGQAGSHSRIGWKKFTDSIIGIVDRPGVVALAWGAHAAHALADCQHMEVIASAHPSPLSARRGFFGSRPFSRANEALITAGRQPINW